MGSPKTAIQRLNLAQAFNPIGSLTGMFVASMFVAPNLDIETFRTQVENGDPDAAEYLVQDYPNGLPDFKTEFGALDKAVSQGLLRMKTEAPDEFAKMQQHDLEIVRAPYVGISIVVIGFLVVFFLTPMPKISDDDSKSSVGELIARLLKKPAYVGGVIAQTFYVGAQITCWTFIIHYAMEQVGLTLAQAQMWNITAMVIFLTSRFVCTFLLKFVDSDLLLAISAILAVVFTIGVVWLPGNVGLVCLVIEFGVYVDDVSDDLRNRTSGVASG